MFPGLFLSLLMAGSPATGGGLDCVGAPDTSADRLDGLCAAMRARGAAGRLTLLADGATALRVEWAAAGPGSSNKDPLVIDFSVTDRDLRPEDFNRFARDILRASGM